MENNPTAANKTGHWRFSRKQKCLIAVAIAAVLLVSIFAMLPGPNGSPFSGVAQWFGVSTESGQGTAAPNSTLGLIESSQSINSNVLRSVAADAWAYFQPGVGVDANTGLPYADGTNFKAFTDWDLGVYIQSVIDAQKIGLISTGGAWGSYARLETVLNFLETRPLNDTTHYPFWFYDATTGNDYHSLSDTATDTFDVVDTGRLFVALNNLKAYNPEWAQQIDNFVYNTYGNRSNYAAVLSTFNDGAANGMYGYYFINGYASFWPQQIGNIPNGILTNMMNSPTVTTYGVTLPKAPISCEPLLSAVFELNNSGLLMNLMNKVYQAHEAYYDSTGNYVAFSEGNAFSGNFVWEWVVAPDGKPWEITQTDGSIYQGNQILYDKVAFSFLALYNTSFARNLVIHILKELPDPTNGFSDGVDTSGRVVPGEGSNTNGLILDAAMYALQNGT